MQPTKKLRVYISETDCVCCTPEQPSGPTIMELPNEILEYIFSLLGCEEILRTVRKVCTYFSDIVRCLMKRKFLSVGKLIESEFRELEQAHTSYDNVDAYYNEVIHTFKMESLRFHYQLLRAVVWRYVLVPDTKWCFYGGRVLDLMLYMLQPHYKRNYGITTVKNDVIALQSLAKRFCNHFERHLELTINRDYSVSGAKLVDLLNCVVTPEINKIVNRSDVTRNGTRCVYTALYRFPRTWFTCIKKIKNTFGRPPKEPASWSAKQRLMFLRIRRIVFNYNILTTRQQFYDIIALMRNVYIIPRNELSFSSYSGFGESDGKFFYYGCMTEDNYNVKFIPNFQHPHQQAEDDVFEEDEGFVGDAEEFLEEPGVENTNPVVPSILVFISIDLASPMSLAPYDIISNYRTNKAQDMECILEKEKSCKHLSMFHLHMTVECLASKENKLPHSCKWCVCSTRCPS